MLAEGMFLVDRYEILNKVGAGGMSDVYKAKDHILGRIVAIKVLKQEFSEDINFVTKFRTEAQSAAGLEHPNIVNIYDVGSESGLHFIVMEYIIPYKLNIISITFKQFGQFDIAHHYGFVQSSREIITVNNSCRYYLLYKSIIQCPR